MEETAASGADVSGAAGSCRKLQMHDGFARDFLIPRQRRCLGSASGLRQLLLSANVSQWQVEIGRLLCDKVSKRDFPTATFRSVNQHIEF